MALWNISTVEAGIASCVNEFHSWVKCLQRGQLGCARGWQCSIFAQVCLFCADIYSVCFVQTSSLLLIVMKLMCT